MCTTAAQAGTTSRMIREQTGHASYASTERYVRENSINYPDFSDLPLLQLISLALEFSAYRG